MVKTVLLVATRLQVMPHEMWQAVLSMLVAEPASFVTYTVAGDGKASSTFHFPAQASARRRPGRAGGDGDPSSLGCPVL